MLSPQDIQNQQFHVRFRGFDTEEVDEILEQAAATVQQLEEENRELKKRLETAERRVAAYKRQEKSTMSAILSAQNVAQEMKEKAREEARGVLAKAREEAKGLEESAGREISELEREVDRLRGIKSRVREEMRQLLESHLHSLDADREGDHSASNRWEVASGPGTGSNTTGGADEAATTDDELYQRIVLTDDLLPPLADEDHRSTGQAMGDAAGLSPWEVRGEGGGASNEEGEERGGVEEGDKVETAPPATISGQEDDHTLPDLDGDMVFTLEDPLDTEEDEEAEEEQDRGPVIRIDDEPDPEPVEESKRTLNWLRSLDDDRAVLIRVRAQPGATRTEVRGEYGEDGEALKIAVAAPPVDGKANDALISFLARRCGVPKRAITLTRGETGRDKSFRLEGISGEQVATALLLPATSWSGEQPGARPGARPGER